jgi:hypothetical protein
VRCNFTWRHHYTPSPSLCLFTSISLFIHLFSSFHSILTPLVPSLIAVEVESLMTILLCAARRQRFSLELLQLSNSRMVPATSHFPPRTSFHYQLSSGIKDSNFLIFDICLWYVLTIWMCHHSYGQTNSATCIYTSVNILTPLPSPLVLCNFFDINSVNVTLFRGCLRCSRNKYQVEWPKQKEF